MKKEALKIPIIDTSEDEFKSVSFSKKIVLFSDRNKNINKTDFVVAINEEVRRQISKLFSYFYCETIERPNKYDSWTDRSSNERHAWRDLYQKYELQGKPDFEYELIRREEFFIFDAIESWNYHTGDVEFANSVNQLFEYSDLPYRLMDGKIIKIDAKQFEQELLFKHLKELEELKIIEPRFQNAYKELISALDKFELANYMDAIFNATQSYESIIKVVCNKNDGQADGNIKHSLTLDFFNDLPIQINKEGFKNNVLMALPYIRNQTKAGHGKGDENIIIPKSLAKLAINLSCALSAYYVELFRGKL